jgi:peptidoglycan/xylan/chitin deacetylase (PgdA/CDA1 family)
LSEIIKGDKMIKRFFILGIIFILSISTLNATIYEDAEDGTINRWIINDNDPAGAVVRNVYDETTHSRVIEVNGTTTYENQYQLGREWNNAEEFNIKWDMKTTEGFIIDIIVTSTGGERYLRYTDNEESHKGKDDDIIYHGLGYYPANGNWHTFRRNLVNDLNEFEPNNQIISIDTFLIRGNCRLDDIELFKNQNRVYEDAEDGQSSRWRIYLGSEEANISNIYDVERDSRVISLVGDGYENQYIIGGDGIDNEGAWGDTHSNIKWSIKNSEGFIIYLTVNSQNGVRYIKYSDNDFSHRGINGDEIYYGLGYNASNGEWHTFIRDIDADIKEFEPNNRFISIDGFLVIGSAEIDDLELFNILHPSSHRAGVTLTFDDHDVDGWFSVRDIYLEYGAKVTFFLDEFHNLTPQEINKLKSMEEDGHEIGCHTYSHKGIGRDYNYDTSRIDEYLQSQIIPALNNMKNAGFNPTSLAYPYGEHEDSFDTAVRDYFPNLRITASDSSRTLSQLDEIYHKRGKYYNLLAGDGIDNSYDNEIDEIRDALLKARKEGEIITLYAHQVLYNSSNPYAISPEKLEMIVEIAKNLGLQFYTFKEAYLVGQ